MSKNRSTKNALNKLGVTTRLIDRCVQELFNNEVTYLYEKRTGIPQMVENYEALERFKKRMKSEHKHIKFSYKYGIFDNIKCFKIQLIN